MNRFRSFAYQVSKNHTRTCWVLKCDIRKFFASIDHQILYAILEKYIQDEAMLWLLREVVNSFSSRSNLDVGLPLGNLTSQLLVNVYLNEFDQYVKHQLKVKYYIRYADDFVLLSHDKSVLQQTLPYMEVFLREHLKLSFHPDKVYIKTLASGVDFLGWVHFADHRVLRTATKRRMLRRLCERLGQEGAEATRQAYLGMLSQGNTKKLRDRLV